MTLTLSQIEELERSVLGWTRPAFEIDPRDNSGMTVRLSEDEESFPGATVATFEFDGLAQAFIAYLAAAPALLATARRVAELEARNESLERQISAWEQEAPERIAELEEAVGNMTPGEWYADLHLLPAQGRRRNRVASDDGGVTYEIYDVESAMSAPTNDRCNAIAIAALKNAAPALLAAARRALEAEERVAKLEEALGEACDVADRAIEANEILPSTNSEAITRLRTLLRGGTP